MDFYTDTNRADKANVHIHARVHTHRAQRHRCTNISNSNQQSKACTPRKWQTYTASRRKGRRTQWHRQTCHSTHAWRPVLNQTHLHTSLHLCPQHTHIHTWQFWSRSPAPTYDAKPKTSFKLERLHWGKKKGREGISCYILHRDFFVVVLTDKDSL